MDRTSYYRAWPAILIVACLLAAGCFEDDTAGPVTPVTTAGPLYSAGDIVENPSSAAGPAWLVIRYDAAADTYERAMIYRNADGSWGYRVDSRTDTVSRPVMEKVYTRKAGSRAVSSVPIVTPTVVATVSAIPTSVPVTTETTPVPKSPVIKSIIPDKGNAGSNVSIQNLGGENFIVGARIMLSRNESSFSAVDVRYVSNTSLICTLVIPADAAAGSWDVTVINPDGQHDTYTKIFTVSRPAEAGTTTTTASSGGVSITFIDPASVSSMGSYRFVMTGSGFQNAGGVTRVTLQKAGSGDIEGTSVDVRSSGQIQFSAYFPVASRGVWDIVVTNPDGTSGRWNGALTVRS